MHEIIDEHRDGPKIVPGTAATPPETPAIGGTEIDEATEDRDSTDALGGA